jgi:restriction system protein
MGIFDRLFAPKARPQTEAEFNEMLLDIAQETFDKLYKQVAALARATIETAVMDHENTLRRKRRQLTVPNEYAGVDTSAWVNEAVAFLHQASRYYQDIFPQFEGLLEHALERGLFSSESYRDLHSQMATTWPVRQIEDILDAQALPESPANARGLEAIGAMTPIEFERLVAQRLTDWGWQAGTTKRSGDQGVDVIAEKNGVSLVVQCKHTSARVGNGAVQEAVAGRGFENAHHAAVVTSGPGYTSSARQLAQMNNVTLLHYDDIAGLTYLPQ